MKNLKKGFLAPIIIAVIALLAVSGGIYIYTNIKIGDPSEIPDIVSNVSKTTPENIETTSIVSTNIIKEDSEISGAFQGYYYPYVVEGEYLDEHFSETCAGFFIKAGNEDGLKLKDYFINLIRIGNTVNKLSASNDLILNINKKDIDNLSKIERDTLMKSSSTNEVIIYIKKVPLEGRSATYCESLVNLYKVDDYQLD